MNSITLEVANKDELPLFENLASLYLHDLSSYADDLQIDNSGKFTYDGLHLYFKELDLIPMLIKRTGTIIGFILLNTGSYVDEEIDFCVNEFFILKSYRRENYGTMTVKQLFHYYPGCYKIGQLKSNIPAIKFWKTIYDNLEINYIQKEEVIYGLPCVYQNFCVN